jgi:hypothetical protein
MTLPWTPPGSYTPTTSDVWFDDGSARSVAKTFGGSPTFLWFSYDPFRSVLYESKDAITWGPSGHHQFGRNGSGETDDTYVGAPPDNSYGKVGGGTWGTAYGALEVAGHTVKMQVAISGAKNVMVGAAGQKQSKVALPVPPAAQDLADLAHAGDIKAYNDQVELLQKEQEGLALFIPKMAAVGAWDAANNHPELGRFYATDGGFGGNYEATVDIPNQIAAVQAQIDAIPHPKPRSAQFTAKYIAYSPQTIAGRHGIFVVMGYANQDGIYDNPHSITILYEWTGGGWKRIDFVPFPNSSANVPVFWWTQDGTTWAVGNTSPLTGAMSFEDRFWAHGCAGIVGGGNVVDQIYAVTP